ncbi:unnamed protein product, partial [Ostreobium quekettii]
LGLGAKFLPHKKAVALAATAERSLGRKLGIYKKPHTSRKSIQEMEEAHESPSSGKDLDDEQEEDASRSVTFSSRKCLSGKRKSAASLRAALLERKGIGKSGKKRKR